MLLGSTLIVAGAMAGRGLSSVGHRLPGLVISLLLVALTAWYCSLNVKPPIAAGYGLYVGGAFALAAVVLGVGPDRDAGAAMTGVRRAGCVDR